MGLRQLKAQRTRDALHEAVLTLAEQHGYDSVTIEQIAETAEVGISTLYRYYPNKDAILLAPIAEGIGGLAEGLRARPADEPLDEALGHVLHDYLSVSSEESKRTRRLRAQLDIAPGPRARLWDHWNQERSLLEDAIAAHTASEPGDLRVALAAHTTMMIAQLALDRQRDAVDDAPLGTIADDVIATLEGATGIIPRLPAAR